MILGGRYKIFFFVILFVLLLGGGIYSLNTYQDKKIKVESSKVSQSETPKKVQREVKSSSIQPDKIYIEPYPLLSYTLPFSDKYRLIVELRIDYAKTQRSGDYWCGAPFYLDYKGEAAARIVNKENLISDEIELTSPTLVLGSPPNYDFYFYKLYDLDGDGEKSEFMTLTYFSCNGNFLQAIKIDKEKGEFANIPFHLEGGVEEKIFVGPTRKYFNFNNRQLWIKSYDMFVGKFYKDVFKYQNGVFERLTRTEESL